MAAFFCKIGGAVGDVGEIKFGFNAPEDAYDNINDELGITLIKERNDRSGVAFGINYPKPPRVRINYGDRELLGDDNNRSCLRFCDPDKLGQVLNGALNDKKVTVAGTEYPIKSVSMPQA